MRAIWLRWNDERGTVLVLALFIMAFLLVAGAFLLRMSGAESDIAYNTVWSEGAFFAADAALNVALDRTGPTVTSNVAIPQSPLGNSYQYTPNVQFIGTTALPGYSVGTGTGYNPAGYVFYTYTLTGTGNGPRSSQRQVEARSTFGPVAQ